MTKLGLALLKLEGDWITWITVAQQAIETAKHLMKETPQGVDGTVACMNEYQRAA